jgi:Bacterial regulatory proteins, gntR family
MPISVHAHALTSTRHPGTVVSSKPSARLRRVNRSRETTAAVVLAAVPEGMVRAAHGRQTMTALLTHEKFAQCNRNGRATIAGVLRALIARADYDSMTTRPGWEALIEATGTSRTTVARVLRLLAAWGLIGRVATGRQAKYAAVGPDGRRINEAAVYVLCAPSPLALVHKVGTPPALGGSHLNKKKLTHTRAREKNPNTDVAPPRLIPAGTTSGASTPHVPWRPELLWPAHRTTNRRIQRVAASSEIRYRSFPLRCMTPKDIANSCRDFFLAGWTVADIIHALDWRPDGTLWPHSGAPDTKDARRMRGWLRHRLNAWRTASGEPLRSRDQQAAARAAALRREQHVERQRILERQAARAAQLDASDSPAKVTALAKIRAMFDAGKRQRSTGWTAGTSCASVAPNADTQCGPL